MLLLLLEQQQKPLLLLLPFPHGATAPSGPGPPDFRGSTNTDISHSLRLLCTSDRPVTGCLYLTTQKNHDRETSMSPAVFEPAIPADERQQTYTYGRAASWIRNILSFQTER